MLKGFLRLRIEYSLFFTFLTVASQINGKVWIFLRVGRHWEMPSQSWCDGSTSECVIWRHLLSPMPNTSERAYIMMITKAVLTRRRRGISTTRLRSQTRRPATRRRLRRAEKTLATYPRVERITLSRIMLLVIAHVFIEYLYLITFIFELIGK